MRKKPIKNNISSCTVCVFTFFSIKQNVFVLIKLSGKWMKKNFMCVFKVYCITGKTKFPEWEIFSVYFKKWKCKIEFRETKDNKICFPIHIHAHVHVHILNTSKSLWCSRPLLWSFLSHFCIVFWLGIHSYGRVIKPGIIILFRYVL